MQWFLNMPIKTKIMTLTSLLTARVIIVGIAYQTNLLTLNAAMGQLNQATQQNAAASEQLAATASRTNTVRHEGSALRIFAPAAC